MTTKRTKSGKQIRVSDMRSSQDRSRAPQNGTGSVDVGRLARLTLSRRLTPDRDIRDLSVLFEVKAISTTGCEKLVYIKPSELLTPKQAMSRIADGTGWPLGDQEYAKGLIAKLSNQAAVREVKRTGLSGWRSSDRAMGCFVMPRRTFGRNRREYEFHSGVEKGREKLGASKGSLGEWQKHVAHPLGQSSAGMAMVGAAFASTLLPFSNLPESFMLLLIGTTTSGKSTLQSAAMSVQGAPSEPISPDSTERAIHEEGGRHNNLMMPVGDLSELLPRQKKAVLHHLTYGVSSNGGRKTSQQVATALANYEFKVIVTCTSEKSAKVIAKEANMPQLGGERARCFDLVPAAGGMGFFDMVRKGEERGGAAIADDLKESASLYYGTAIGAWIAALAKEEPAVIQARVESLTRSFVKLMEKSHALTPVKRRAAAKFGLLYAALVMAKERDVLRWKEGRIRRAVTACFEGAMRETTEMSSAAAIMALKDALLVKGALLAAPNEKAVRAQARTNRPWLGVRAMKEQQKVVGLRPEVIRQALGAELAELAFSSLESDGLLVRGKGSERWQKRVQANGKPRMYVLSPEFLD